MGINILEARRRVMMEQPHIETLIGNPVSFKAEALPLQELKVGINPVQDLHGQDAPYPPGGGKNLFNNTAETTTINGVTFTVNSDGTISCSGNATATAIYYPSEWAGENGISYILNGCPSGGGNSTYKLDYNNNRTYVVDSGAGVSFTSGGVAGSVRIVIYAGYGNGLTFKPMIRLSSVTDGTFAPYSNICPISGHTGVNVSRTGKNLLSSTTYQQSSDTLVIGQNQDNSHQTVQMKAGTYTFKCDNNVIANLYCRITNGSVTRITPSGKTNINITFTLDNDGLYAFWLYQANGITPSNYTYYQLETGSTATAYEPYTCNTYPITWETAAGTVYGGTLDVLAGELTVDRASVDMGTLTWTKYASETQTFFYASPPQMKNSAVNTICSHFPRGSEYPQHYTINASLVRVYGTEYEDANAFKQAMSGAQFCYDIATPTTVTLSAQQISSLLGMNNLWNDINGDNTVSFYTH